jgi:hypothetical protein
MDQPPLELTIGTGVRMPEWIIGVQVHSESRTSRAHTARGQTIDSQREIFLGLECPRRSRHQVLEFMRGAKLAFVFLIRRRQS